MPGCHGSGAGVGEAVVVSPDGPAYGRGELGRVSDEGWLFGAAIRNGVGT